MPSHLHETLVELFRNRYESDFARRFFGQGEARAIFTVLEARGLEVSIEARERISVCTDVDQLDEWVRRAVTVESIEELFAS